MRFFNALFAWEVWAELGCYFGSQKVAVMQKYGSDTERN